MRTIALLLMIVFATSLSSCTTNTKPNGGKFSYDCSGLGKGWGDCTEKADAQCGAKKYDIISQTGSADEKGANGNTEMRRTLVVVCR